MSQFRKIFDAVARPFGARNEYGCRRGASRRHRRVAAARLGGCEQLEPKQVMAANLLAAIADQTLASTAPFTINLANHFDESAVTGTVVKFETNAPLANPDFFVELFDQSGAGRTRTTPLTVANFLSYVNDPDALDNYDETIVHRAVPGFVIQGGGYTAPDRAANLVGSDPVAVPQKPAVTNEPGNVNARGTIAMAKLPNLPNSGTNQFFFNLANNTGLNTDNGGFTVFGRVLGSGMTVIDTMASALNYDATTYYGNQAFDDFPLWNVNSDNIVQPNDFVKFKDVSVVPEAALMSFTVTSANTAKLTAAIVNGQLVLTPAAGQTGPVNVTVTGRSALDNSTISDTFAVELGATAPSAPTNVAGVAGNAQVSLTWTAPSSNGGAAITDYVIQHSSNSGTSWTTFSDGTSTTTSATVTGLTNGTSYLFRVSAVNAAGTGAASTNSAAVMPRAVAGAPTAVTATPGNTQVGLTWTAPSSNGGAAITDYVIEQSSNSGTSWTTFSDGTSTNTSATVTGLTNGTSYLFRVSAVNAVGTGAASANSAPVALSTVAAAPTAVVATPGNAQVSLTWTAPPSNGGSTITDYVVEQSSDGGRSWTPFSDGTSATTSAAVTGLTNGRSYTFRVSAVNAAGTGSASTKSATVTPRTVATAPTALVATPGNAQVSLTWAAPSSTGGSVITDYVIEYSANNGTSWTTFNDGTSVNRLATVTGLANGASYLFRVSAVNAAGVGPASTTSLPVALSTVAGAPTAVIATAGNAQVSLTWTAPTLNGGSTITDYVVEQSSDGGRSWTTFSDGTSATTVATVTGLTNGKGYVFRVSAVNIVGTGPASARTETVTPRSVAAAPTAVVATPGNAQVSLTWAAPASNGGATVTDYVVQQSSDGGRSWTTFSDGTSATRSAVVTGLTNGRNYVFRVAAVNAVGTGSASPKSATVAPRTFAAAPPVVTAMPGNAQVSLSWGAPASNGGAPITDYLVQYSSNNGTSWTTFSDGTSTNRSATVTGLVNGASYLFRVSSVNGAGVGPASTNSAPVTLLSVSGAPTALIATPGNAQVSLAWAAPAWDGGATITDYLIQYSSDGGRSWLTFIDGTNTNTSATVTGLTNGKGYVFRVSAVNAVGAGPASTRTGTVTPSTVALS